MQLVSIPPGSSQWGALKVQSRWNAARTKTATHRTNHRAFEIGKTVVTQKQWQAVMGSNPSRYKGDTLPWSKSAFRMHRCSSQAERTQRRIPLSAADRSRMGICARAGTADQFAGANVADSLARRSPSDDWAWYNERRRNLWQLKSPMLGASTICAGTWRNGCRIGTTPSITRRVRWLIPSGPDRSDGGGSARWDLPRQWALADASVASQSFCGGLPTLRPWFSGGA